MKNLMVKISYQLHIKLIPLDKGKLRELNEIRNFKRFHLEDGVITWYNNLDVAPEKVYLLSHK